MSDTERLAALPWKRLRRVAQEAQATYVGRHWPSMEDMRRDGIGYGLVEDAAHERFIRRFLDTFQPEFVVDLLDRLANAQPAPAPDPCPHCDPRHEWPCPTIPRCDEPGCLQEGTCSWPTRPGGTGPNGGGWRTCWDHSDIGKSRAAEAAR